MKIKTLSECIFKRHWGITSPFAKKYPNCKRIANIARKFSTGDFFTQYGSVRQYPNIQVLYLIKFNKM